MSLCEGNVAVKGLMGKLLFWPLCVLCNGHGGVQYVRRWMKMLACVCLWGPRYLERLQSECHLKGLAVLKQSKFHCNYVGKYVSCSWTTNILFHPLRSYSTWVHIYLYWQSMWFCIFHLCFFFCCFFYLHEVRCRIWEFGIMSGPRMIAWSNATYDFWNIISAKICPIYAL